MGLPFGELPTPKTPADIPHPPKNPKEQSENPPKTKEQSDKGKDRSDGLLPAVSAGLGALGLRGALIPNPEAAGTGPFIVGPEARVFHATFRVATPRVVPGDEVVNAHHNHLHRLTVAGKLERTGIFGSGDHYLQFLVAASREEAEELIAQDPFVGSGAYRLDELHEIFPE